LNSWIDVIQPIIHWEERPAMNGRVWKRNLLALSALRGGN
jgi:hypothetical protein